MKKVILFGASNLGIRAYETLKNEFDISYFCDNDSKKWGGEFCGIEVIQPELLKKYSDYKIIITSMYYKEIYKQLKVLNINDICLFGRISDEISSEKVLLQSEFYVGNEKIYVSNLINSIGNINMAQMVSEYLNRIENETHNGLTLEDICIYDNIAPYTFFRGHYYDMLIKIFYYSLFINKLIESYDQKIVIKTQDDIFFELAKQMTNIKCEFIEKYSIMQINSSEIEKLEKVNSLSKLNFEMIISNIDMSKDTFLVISQVERIKYMKKNIHEKKLYDTFYGEVLEKLREKYNVIYLRNIFQNNEAKLNKFFEYKDKSITENIIIEYVNNLSRSEELINVELLKNNDNLLDQIDFSFGNYDLRSIMKKYVFNILKYKKSIEKVLGIERFIKEFNIKHLISIDEYDNREFIVACNRVNIPCYGLQHGLYSKYHYQFFYSKYNKILAPKKTFVWGEKFEKMFLENSNLFNENNIYISGQPINDLSINYMTNGEVKNKNIFRIVYISTGIYDIDYKSIMIILTTLKLFEKEYELTIRLHPLDFNYDLYNSIINKHNVTNYVLDQEGDLYEIINNSDLIIGINSTVMIEALIFNKNIATIITNQFGDEKGLVKEGLSAPIENMNDLLYILNNFDDIVKRNENRSAFIEKYFFNIDGKVADRIIKECD